MKLKVYRREHRWGASLQRSLTAPVAAAATVALAGFSARGAFLIGAPLQYLVGLFVAVALAASFGAGLFTPRKTLSLSIAIAACASGTAGFLLWKTAGIRRQLGAGDAVSIELWLIVAAVAVSFVISVPLASAGSHLRAWLARGGD